MNDSLVTIMTSNLFKTSFILPDGLDLGGVTTWSVDLADRLSQTGRQTTLLQHGDRYASSDLTLPDGVEVIKCLHCVRPNNWYLFRKDIDEYIQSYRRVLPSVLIPNYSFGAYAACAHLAAISPDKVRVIGMAHTDNAEYYRWLVQFEPIIHKFVAVSQEIAVKLTALLPHRQHDIVTRPYGVHVSEQYLSRHYSSSSDTLQLMYAGRLSERQKRVSDMIRLVAKLDEQDVDFRLQIYGSGRDERFLTDTIQALPKSARRRVQLAGQLPPSAMISAYRQADIHVLVSEYEGTSVSMLEAMAQGCVPVVTAVSGTALVVRQGINGFSVPVGDMTEMAKVIVRLAQDRKKLAQLGNAAQATIKEEFSYTDYAPWFSDLLDGICQQEPRRWQRKRPFYFHLPLRQFIKEAAYVLAAKPGFRWLYGFRGQGRKMIQ